MHRRVWLIGVPALAALCGLAAFILLRESPETSPAPAPTLAPQANARTVRPTVVTPTGRTPTVHPSAQHLSAAPVASQRTAPTAPAPRLLRIHPAQTLATVRGAKLTLADLFALDPKRAGQPVELDPATYASLLDRAIDRQLTLQAAAEEGVTLTAEQQARIDARRAAQRKRHEDPNLVWRDEALSGDAALEFQLRDASAKLLQATLAEQAGVASPRVTADDVQRYYEAHASTYGALPTEPNARAQAWRQIDTAIRQQLARTADTRYQEAMTGFMRQMRATSAVTVSPPG